MTAAATQLDTVLGVGVALSLLANLLILFVLARILRIVAPANTSIGLKPGTPLPPIQGRRANGSTVCSADLEQRAIVFIFLAAGCASCRVAKADVREMLVAGLPDGLELFIIEAPIGRERETGIEPSFSAHALVIDVALFRALNPALSFPTYMFVGADLRVQASGLVGDDQWSRFRSQVATLIES